MKTLEQQYHYQGDFALFVMEVTDEGAIVQDVTTGVFGFLPQEQLGPYDSLVPGDTVQGARCTFMDTTVIQSPDPRVLRMQTGMVYEWDEENGEGFIIPSEEQDAFRMIRVYRRDISWHDSRRLFPGQFLQFETALPEEVPWSSELDPRSPVALRVRGLEILFSLKEAYELIPEGSREPLLLEESKQAPQLEAPSEDVEKEAESLDALAVMEEARSLAPSPDRTAFPVTPERPELAVQKKVHPLLQRFASDAPQLAQAESPSWLWQPQLDYFKEENYAPIMPVQLGQVPVRPKRKRILVHEVAHERGDTWQEAAQRKGVKLYNKMKPPGRRMQEKLSMRFKEETVAIAKEKVRRAKWDLNLQQKRAWHKARGEAS
ncbi:Pentatricopeptide repeat-containing protein [Durusdinium trenchii]|uniref:Pentatricopeptide repeat-containing protein n=1 Tax=Durusdinium trenchii TaxID=1381693 RepID=A0ABP0LLH0_9DINO